MRIWLGACVAAVMLAAQVEGQTRREGVHQHGKSTLNVAIDGATLAIELEGALVNFVGFEHAPATADERDALESAVATLKRPQDLFAVVGGDCRPASTKVDLSELEAGEATDHAADHGESHADLAATYEFQCRAPAGVSSLSVQILERFPATEELVVNVLSQDRQAQVVLERGSDTISLR